MIFLIMLVVFCYVLHRMCIEKGIAAWGYLLAFITGFFLIIFATSVTMIILYGRNVMSDPEMPKKLMALAPFTMLFHFLLFILFRRKISRIPDYPDDNDDSQLPPTSNGKKDLSYFR